MGWTEWVRGDGMGWHGMGWGGWMEWVRVDRMG